MIHFSSGFVCLAVNSNPYDAAYYYRDYEEFLRDAKAK